MIRVLHIFHQMANGGVEHFVMNFYRNIDRSEVQFDFLTSVESDGYFDEEIRALGGKLYRAYPLKKNPIRNYFDIAHIVQKNQFEQMIFLKCLRNICHQKKLLLIVL